MPISEQDYQQYQDWGKPPPSSQAHGTERDIWKNMTRLQPTQWRQEGNMLIGETEMGTLSQRIPTEYLLQGTDNSGRPILTKIGE